MVLGLAHLAQLLVFLKVCVQPSNSLWLPLLLAEVYGIDNFWKYGEIRRSANA